MIFQIYSWTSLKTLLDFYRIYKVRANREALWSLVIIDLESRDDGPGWVMETPEKGGQLQTALHIALLTTVWKDYIKRDVFFQVYDFHEKKF